MSHTDHLDIANLFARLSRALDDNDLTALTQVYTEDVTASAPRGGELTGLAAVLDHLRDSQVGTEKTQHCDADLLIDLNGDEARASANQTVYFFRDGEPPHQTSGLRVTYTAVRTPAGWRFRAADIKLQWTRKE